MPHQTIHPSPLTDFLFRLPAIVLSFIATAIFTMSILGVPIMKTVSVASFSISAPSGVELEFAFGILGFCRGLELHDYTPAAVPYQAFNDTLDSLSEVPGLGDAAQTLQSTMSALATGPFLMYILAGTLSFFALIHDGICICQLLNQKRSITVSGVPFVLGTIACISSLAIFRTLDGPIEALDSLPDVTATTQTRSFDATLMTLGAAITQGAVMGYKLWLRRYIRELAGDWEGDDLFSCDGGRKVPGQR